MNKCVFCAQPSEVLLKRYGTGQLVPVCRHCVPVDLRLTWAENQSVTAVRKPTAKTSKGAACD